MNFDWEKVKASLAARNEHHTISALELCPEPVRGWFLGCNTQELIYSHSSLEEPHGNGLR